jgi:hypothetical protein
MSVRHSRSAHPPMTKVAMPLDKLDVWLQGRTGAAATNLSMLDGFVTAVVAGPISMDPPEWICPLLGIEIDAFNHGGTPEFAAISAAAVRHNAIVETLTNAPKTQDLRTDLRAQAGQRRRCGFLVRGLLRRNEVETIGVGAAQESRRHQSRSVAADPVPLRRRSGASDARPAQEGAGNRTVQPDSLQGHSGRRRRNASVLDADTLQDRIVAAERTWKLAPLTIVRASNSSRG